MLLFTSCGSILKHTQSVTGLSIIGFIVEPTDTPKQINELWLDTIYPKIASADSTAHILSVADSLHKYLHHKTL